MSISINPVLPVLSAQEAGGIAPELVLQPGRVVNAQVLKVLSADLVRIAIASLSIDVASEIAGGDRAGAGATDQPRSEPRRRRHQDGVPEIRDLPRGVASGRFSAPERRSRSQGRADRASPDAAVGAW